MTKQNNFGVVDIGTNSVRMLLARENECKKPVVEKTFLVTTRLGEGVASSGQLSNQAITRTIEALKKFKAHCQQLEIHDVQVIATSAVRDADNKEHFINSVKVETGWKVQVIPGEEEAYLGYTGVIKGLPRVPKTPIVIDIGGGSTELIWSVDGNVNYTSTQAGAVRMTEQHNSRADIIRILTPVIDKMKDKGLRNAVGIGGTITTLAAVDQGLEVYSAEMVHGYEISVERIRGIYRKLSQMSLNQRKQVKGLQEERADIILAGILILDVILDELEFEKVIVSETDIMYGLAYDYFNSH